MDLADVFAQATADPVEKRPIKRCKSGIVNSGGFSALFNDGVVMKIGVLSGATNSRDSESKESKRFFRFRLGLCLL